MKLSKYVQPLTTGGEYSIEKVALGNNLTFARLKCGTVVVLSRRGPISLGIGVGYGAKDRSAFCKLSGIKVKEYEAFLRQEKRKEEAEEKKREFRAMEREAARSGYRLVKIKAKSGASP